MYYLKSVSRRFRCPECVGSEKNDILPISWYFLIYNIILYYISDIELNIHRLG